MSKSNKGFVAIEGGKDPTEDVRPPCTDPKDHVALASRLINECSEHGEFVHTDGCFWHYDRNAGIFRRLETQKMSARVQDWRLSQMRSADVSGTVKLAADRAFTPDYFEHRTPGIVFENGFLKVDEDGLTLVEHDADYRARFAYPFPFEPGDPPSRFLDFLNSVFRDDEDREEKIELVQEYIGACLLGLAAKYQRVLILVGDGGNGKGVCSTIVEGCMPPGSVCAIAPQKLGQEYYRARLAGKLVNIVAELPEADILDSESFKQVVSGDPIDAREIRQSPFTYRPIAGHIYSANRLPGTADHTRGFWRRILLITFNRAVPEGEEDENLATKILQSETPQIVSWALSGARRLMAAGHYTKPSSMAGALEEWKHASDQVLQFVDDRCERLPLDVPLTAGAAAMELYQAFVRWTEANGHRAMSSTKFGTRMRLLGLEGIKGRDSKHYPVRLTGVW